MIQDFLICFTIQILFWSTHSSRCTALYNRLLTLSASKASLSSLIIAEMNGTISSSLLSFLKNLIGTCIENYSLYTEH